MTEFELIARFFAEPAARRRGSTGRDVDVGIGDDCALVTVPAGHELAVSTDLLVAGRHFFDDVEPAALGWKALAVNLSDLAAMGAKPLGFTLALALPSVDGEWLDGFSRGLFDCADAFGCALIGGDTTRGPLTLSITVLGAVASGCALRRDAARAGDDVWLSGTVGGAAFALRRLVARRAGDSGVAGDSAADLDRTVRDALERPVPRVALGRALVGVAHAAIDVSDGLAQDLGHVLSASRCTARVRVDAVPTARSLASCDVDERRRLALTGGDDYELCFTAAAARRDEIAAVSAATDTPVTRIGSIEPESGVLHGDARLHLVDANGADWPPADGRHALRGFDHFA